VRAGEAKAVPEEVDEEGPCRDRRLAGLAVDGDGEGDVSFGARGVGWNGVSWHRGSIVRAPEHAEGPATRFSHMPMVHRPRSEHAGGPLTMLYTDRRTIDVFVLRAVSRQRREEGALGRRDYPFGINRA
jgi:hypothetical protein